MDRQEITEKIRENRISSLIVLGGVLNAFYSIAVQNWLGLLISIAVIAYLLPDILKED